ncbi:DNA repair protein RecN [Alloscardovia venturai]|uniref:DNA repair protein RecN n=1 Tax=Alloscardovia venturai TaxID=1769421 RepID=A0ABW2Y872_9BIFI
MLEELEIRNLGPISQARIMPHPGMNAITGETGAGKSMLLNAIELISGAQAQSQRVSANSDQARVQAIFGVSGSDDIKELAQNAGAECVDDQLFINRTVPQKGRSRAVLNGQTVPRTVLTSIASKLVTIHGQSEQLKIANISRQRDFLDDFAANDTQRDTYRKAFENYSTLKEKIDQLKSTQSQAIAQIDYLKDAISRIEAIHPHEGEDDELKSQRDYIENATEIAIAQAAALRALDTSENDNDEASVSELLTRAIHELHAVSHIEQMSEIMSRLETLRDEVQDIVYMLSQSSNEDVNPNDLDKINERIHDLSELTKRWGPTLKDVLEWKEKAQFELEDLDASPERIHELEVELTQAMEIVRKAAKELTRTRVVAAEELSANVNKELKSLAMEGSALYVSVSESSELDVHGADDIVFEFVPFPGAPRLSLGKSASGGELSRLMLALELVAFEKKRVRIDQMELSEQRGNVPTLIFDEIDAGVGGATAVELGKRLARLAAGAQIIVVTHLPQVAAWADEQFVVSKTKSASQATTTVTEVNGEARVAEIARMLSGSQSKTSLQHAQELLDECTLKMPELA